MALGKDTCHHNHGKSQKIPLAYTHICGYLGSVSPPYEYSLFLPLLFCLTWVKPFCSIIFKPE